MVGTTSDWEDELGRWLEPFLERLGHRSLQRMCPLYVAGLIRPGDRKSVQPRQSVLRRVTMINCTILLLLASGRRLRWRQNFSSRLISSSAAAMRCW